MNPTPIFMAGGAALAVLLAAALGCGYWALGQKGNRLPPNPTDNRLVQKDLTAPQKPNRPAEPLKDGTPPKEKQGKEKSKEDPPKLDLSKEPPAVNAEKPSDKPVIPPPDMRPDEIKVRELFTCASRHSGPVRTLVISRDGKQVLSLGTDKAIRRFSLENGAEMASFDLMPFPVDKFRAGSIFLARACVQGIAAAQKVSTW